MILTVTPNPSVDRTIEVAKLRRGAVNRARAHRVDAGGKGVNVARALAAHGHKATAIVPSGGAEGAQLLALLSGIEGLDVLTVDIAGAVRANVAVVEPDGTTTKFNEPGPGMTRAELAALTNTVCDAAAGSDWVVVSGSLPPGAPAGWYADLVRRLVAAGERVAVDTSGAPLAKAVAARPNLVKPNRDELAELTGRRLATVSDVVAAARSLDVDAVLASLGPDGAVLVSRSGAWHATAPAVAPRSTVGAGDAALAGFLAAGAEGTDALVAAVAWGSAATALDGTRMPSPRDLRTGGMTITDLTSETGPYPHLTESS